MLSVATRAPREDFRASIRALATIGNFDVLSRPSILTTDNKEATVNVSPKVPIVNSSRLDQNNNKYNFEKS